MQWYLFTLSVAFFLFLNLQTTLIAGVSGHFDHIKLPEKISVGPDDSYQAKVKGEHLYYTKNIRLSSQIFKQSLLDGKYQALLDGKSDAKSPSPQPNGEKILFTYFKYDAKGDICLLEDKEVRCITDNKTENRSPTWLNSDTLAYLSRKTNSSFWNLISYNIKSGQKKSILTANIASLASDRQGKFLAFTQISNNQHSLMVFDQKANKSFPVELNLPGLSGFSSFSPNGKYLYFSHYLNDTNADNIIDGNDHSVIFRLPLQKILNASKGKQLPEQMTSVEQNCNFPYVNDKYVYLTCAFQGALDLYRIPFTGVVPKQWSQSQLLEAHQVARTAEERLLILNSLRYRFNKKTSGTMLEKILFHHLQLNEMTAARYYINELIQAEHYPDFFQTLKIYVDIREAKNREKSSLLSQKFKADALQKIRQLPSNKKWHNLTLIIRAYIYESLNMKQKAKQAIRGVPIFDSNVLPLESYLCFELYKKLFDPKKELNRFIELYRSMIDANKIALESKVFLAFYFLKHVEQLHSSLLNKISIVNKFKSQIKVRTLDDLFDSETINYKMIADNDNKSQKDNFTKLKKIYAKTKDQYFLRKAIYIRSLSLFSQANLDTYLERVASYWLRYTKLSHAEFIYAADQFNYVTLEKAYANYQNKKYDLSSSSFFMAMNQTNDLEAHYGYLAVVILKQGNYDKYEQAYKILNKNGKLSTAKPIVEAMLATQKLDGSSQKKMEQLDQLIQSLEAAVTEPFNESLRYLLLAFCYHEKLRMSFEIYDYESTFFEKAHRYYILAEYLAQDNERILASVWENLGILHYEVQNHSISSAYFEKRELLGFAEITDEVTFRLSYARSLFNSHQARGAQQQIQKAMGHKSFLNQKQQQILTERRAFYALHSNDYAVAVEAYASLIKMPHISALNQARFNLALGFAQKKLSHKQAAKNSLLKVLKFSKKIPIIRPQGGRLLGQFPQRFQLIALGLLAELSDGDEDIRYRRNRITELITLEGQVDDFRMKESDRLAQINLAYQQIAANYFSHGQLSESFKHMDLAWQYAKKWYKNGGSLYGETLYKSMSNSMLLAIKTHGHYKVDESDFQEIISEAKEEFSKLKNVSAFQLYKQKKMELFWVSYLNIQSPKKSMILENFMKTADMKRLESELPKKFRELHSLSMKF